MEKDKRKKGENEKKSTLHIVLMHACMHREWNLKKKYFFPNSLSLMWNTVRPCSYKAFLSFHNTDYPCEMQGDKRKVVAGKKDKKKGERSASRYVACTYVHTRMTIVDITIIMESSSVAVSTTWRGPIEFTFPSLRAAAVSKHMSECPI